MDTTTTDQPTGPAEPPDEPVPAASPPTSPAAEPDPPAPAGQTANPTDTAVAPAEPDPPAPAGQTANPTDTAVAPAEPAPVEEDRWAAFAPTPDRPPSRLRRILGRLGRVFGHEWTLATLGSIALAVLMTWPSMRYPGYTLPQDLGDPALVTWILAWPGHILLTDPAQLWHGNAFFPEKWSYAFTDSLLGYAPAGMIGNGPEAAVFRYNVMYVLAFALAFLGAYALVRQLGAGRIAALVAGIAFAYAPWRLGQAGHLHVLSTGGIALALAMLARGHGWSLRYGFRPNLVRPWWILGGWLVAAWQITLGFGVGLVFGYMLAGIAVVVGVIWLVRRAARRQRHPVGRILRANVIGGVVFGAVTVLMALPYLTVVDQHPQARRSFLEVEVFSPPLRGFLTAPEQSWLWGESHEDARGLLTWAPEMALLPGYALLALAVAGLLISIWPLWSRLLLAAGAVVSVMLAMGTEFLGGAVYKVLYNTLPGWDGIRTPGRLIIWTTLLLGLLATGAVDGFLSRARELALSRGEPRPGAWLKLAALVPALLVLMEGLNTTPHVVMPPPPAALSTVEAPILVLPSDQINDMQYMLWTTDRFPQMINGGSGFSPLSQIEAREITATFPDPQSVSYLRSLGVATVVVLPDRVAGSPWEATLTATGDEAGITREDIAGVIVFHLGE